MEVGRYVLGQHDLEDAQLLLLFKYVADVHEQRLEEQSVHVVYDVVGGMSPGYDHGVFFGVWVGEETVRYPRLDLVRIGLARGLWRVEFILGRVPVDDGD